MAEEVAKTEGRELRPLIRIVDKDIEGEESVFIALTRVKGIDFMLSNAICSVLNLNKMDRCGYLAEDDVRKIEDCMEHPEKYGIPVWMLNRRKDFDTGKDKHLVGASVALQQNLDIRFAKKIRTYRGVRHSKGLKVRGQRSKRTGKGGTVGVIRKKEEPAKAPAKAEAKK